MNFALIFAGGTGQRMGTASVPKQFLLAYDKPIIVHTVEKFQNCGQIDAIVIVCLKSHIDFLRTLLDKYNLTKVVSVVQGGQTGQESIFNGLKELVRLYGEQGNHIVLIHDGVRPVIDDKLIIDNIESVKTNGSAVSVSKAIETIVLLDNNSKVDKVMDRQYCSVAKAPQSFFLKDIYSSHLKANSEGKRDFIDSAMMMQYYGFRISTVLCSVNNIKITTPTDYYLFKAILGAKEDEQIKLF